MTDTLARFKQRSDSNANWLSSLEVYSSGELLHNITTNTLKIGNAVDTWSNLDSVDVSPTLLERFQDVTLDNPAPVEGSVFTYVTAFWKWRAGPSILDIDPITGEYYYTLNKLNDVNINYASIQNNDILLWDATTLMFKNSDIVLSSLGSTAVPLLITDSGEPGEIRFDSGFIYVCVAINTWKRAQMFSW